MRFAPKELRFYDELRPMSEYMQQLGKGAREASAIVCRASTEIKNAGLKAIGDEIVARRDDLMIENEKALSEYCKRHGLDFAEVTTEA